MERAVARADRARGRGSHAQRHHHRRPALTAYFDTSAFAKLFVREPGAARVAEIWLRAERRLSSLVLYPEARSALRRARRMGRVSSAATARARQRLELLWEGIDRVHLDTPLVRRAGDLAGTLGLRAYDAVHLASLETARRPGLVFVSADRALLSAASELGFSVVNPLA